MSHDLMEEEGFQVGYKGRKSRLASKKPIIIGIVALIILILVVVGLYFILAPDSSAVIAPEALRLTAGCEKKDTENELSALDVFSRGNEDFSKRFYLAAATIKDPEENLIMSPLSVSAVLGMASLGAQGDTLKDILTALNLPCDSNDLMQGYKDFLPILDNHNQNANTSVSLANRIYVNDKYRVAEKFQQNGQTYFRSKAESLNFGDPQFAASTINGWIEKMTKGKITELIEPGTINQAMQLLLINAVYFKGSWKTPFKEVATAKRDFHGLKSTEKVLMMSHEAPFQTSEFNEPFQGRMLRLPYSNNRLAMYIVLPDEKVKFGDAEQLITDLKLPQLDGNQAISTLINLPKFSTETDFDLVPIVNMLGASRILNPSRADFSSMLQNNTNVHMNEMIQKAVIEVTEAGTEAAAATGATFRMASLNEFVCDRPFFYYIRDEVSGVILFMGRFVKP